MRRREKDYDTIASEKLLCKAILDVVSGGSKCRERERTSAHSPRLAASSMHRIEIWGRHNVTSASHD